VLVEGMVAGAWTYREGRIMMETFEQLSDGATRDVRDEAERLEAFHA
jgi:hypothetical protein